MTILRPILLIIGLLIFLMGLVWMGQGSGYFPYPKSSFMIDSTPWITRRDRAIGLVVVVLSRRLQGAKAALESTQGKARRLNLHQIDRIYARTQ